MSRDNTGDAGWGNTATGNDGWENSNAAAGANANGWGDRPSGDARNHANGDDSFVGGGDTGGNDGCRNCGQSGHFARECPEPRKGGGGGECFNCGQVGHNKADCPNEKVDRPFTGTCHHCEKEGHRASECPDRPAEICHNCKKEGHKAIECKEDRAIDWSKVVDMDPEEAWNKVALADEERDLDDLREAVKMYVKALPATTFFELEGAFRHQSFNTYLIASDKELTDIYTLVNFQGKIDQKYTLGYFFSPKCMRKNLQEQWPSSVEENLERLKEAGIPMDRGVPKCNNCGELGHIARSCSQDKVDVEHITIKCVNCDEEGHRARDCQKARNDPFACRNCKQPGHKADECTEPRSAEGVECRKCGEMGHFSKECPKDTRKCRNCDQEGHQAKDCTEPRNPATITCRNCEESGHFSKECPKPRDYSKVKCSNCSEMGHTKVRCKAPPNENGDGGFGGAERSGGGNWDDGAKTGGGDDWGKGGFAAPPVAVRGNNGRGGSGGDGW